MDKSNKTIHYIFHVEMLEDPIDDFRAVSYTHLDVYKRQDIFFVKSKLLATTSDKY